MDIVNIVLWSLIGLFALVIVGLVIFWLWMEKNYKHRAIIKKPGNRSSQVVFDKFRVMKDKDGTITYKFRKNNSFYGVIPPLPDECVELDVKGRMVGLWYDIDGTLVPGRDGYELMDKKTIMASTKPFTANQRSIYINQFKKSERDKKLSWSEIALAAIPIVSVIVLISVILIFLPDVIGSKAEVDAAKQSAEQQALDTLVIISANLDRIINDRALLTSDTVNVIEVPN